MNIPETIREDGTTVGLVHFAFRVGKQWRVACCFTQGLGDVESFPCVRTDDVRAVTCPVCLKTEGFLEALQELQAAYRRRRR